MTYPDTPSTQSDRDRVVAAAEQRQRKLQIMAASLDRIADVTRDPADARSISIARVCRRAATELRQLAGEEPDDDEARR